MDTLIVDIETVGEAWDELDETTQGVLTRWIDQVVLDASEKEAKLRDLKNGLGFSPLTGFIVAIGVYDINRKQGTVYYQSETDTEDENEGAFFYRPRSEAQMVREFWEGALDYEIVVTFNGRAFDIPFLLHRSIVCGIIPSVDLMRYRYLTQQSPPYHIDLQDQLTFYGAMGKRPSLHLFCQAYGIPSPKSDGVTGDDVATLFAQHAGRTIAQYNAGDLLATAKLYEKWSTFLAPSLFKKPGEAIDF